MTKPSNYDKLFQQSRQIARIGAIGQLLGWDQETYMPRDAIEFRGEQLSFLAEEAHKKKTSKRFREALGKLIDIESGEIADETLTAAQAAAAREWRRDYLRDAKLPTSFVKTFTKTVSRATHVWAEAKRKNQFSLFAPHLEKIVALCRKKATILGFHEHPYDALLDIYEPGSTVAKLSPLLERVKLALVTLLREIRAAIPVDDSCLTGEFAPEKQLLFGHTLLKAMGFDPATSRLDQSSHPFSVGIHPKDTRMTTRIHPGLVASNVLTVLHEGGHGLYHIGLPEAAFGSPLGESASLGIDESQSRLWETIIGKSPVFWTHFYPQLQQIFPEALLSVSLNDFYRAINIVKPSFIRVEADEVTYCLHIILRFEIEKGLIEGSIPVKQLPEVWNTKMRESLGLSPERDDEGCLQDIHWAMGDFGYFPTYLLGNLYAAQFFETFVQEYPDWEKEIAAGNLTPLREWLQEKIHRWGRQFLPEELATRVTGRAVSEEPYLRYLRGKFSRLYGLGG